MNKHLYYLLYKKYIQKNLPGLSETEYQKAIQLFCELIGY